MGGQWPRQIQGRFGYHGGVTVLLWSLISAILLSPIAGQSAFVDVSAERLPTISDASYDFTTGDVDGDGDPDVVIANAGQSRLLLNNGQGHFSDVTASHLPTLSATAMAAALGDVDGDGDLDLVLANAKGQNLLLFNDGLGHFIDATTSHLPQQSDVSMRIQLGDVDRDGDVDMVIANRGSRNRLWFNDGTGVFSDVTATHLPDDNALSYDVELADVNGNGTLDMVIANHRAPNRLLHNNGLGSFTDVTAGHLPEVKGDSIDLLMIDVDRDNDLDLLVTEGTTPLRLLLNDGIGTFSEATDTHLPALDVFGIKVIAGDVDHDGDTDLVLAAAGQDHLLLNDGTGHFSDATDSLVPINTQRTFGAVLLDVDRDLDLDLLLATPGAANRLLLNGLTIPRVWVTTTPENPTVGDTVTIGIEAFDEDGLASALLTLTAPNGNTQEQNLSADLTDGHAAFTFTPIVPGTYTAVIAVADRRGESNTHRATVTVRFKDITAPQVALDTPTSLVVGQTATLHVTTTDDQRVITTSLTINTTPVPLTSDGMATFTPTTAGPHRVVAWAADAAGNEGRAEATVIVDADTASPVVSLNVTPGTTALTHPVSISVSAMDDVAVTSRSLRVTGPAIPEGLEVVMDAAGHAVYTPFQPGTYTLVATAQDPSGNTGTASAVFDAIGQPDMTPPMVSLTVTPSTVALGSPVTLTVTATDNVGVATLTVEVNDTPLPLNTAGVATYTPSITGEYSVIAVARDATENTGSTSATFRVIDPAEDTEPPVVSLTSPTPHTALTAPTEMIGTVSDATLVRYTLEYSPRGENRFTTFATGASEVQESVLGTLDPTLLLNDLYDIRLSAEDSHGRISVTTAVYQVTGQLKVGHVTLSFQDLVVPVVGLPITITRTYDSRDPSQGDFGVAWQLGIQAVTVRESRPLGSGWTQSSAKSGFAHAYCLEPGEAYVTITLPNGRQESFDLVPETPAGSRTSTTFGNLPEYCQFFSPIQVATATFRPRPGTYAQLEALTDNALWVVGDQLLHTGPSGDFDLYAPTRYRLTTPEGMVIDLDKTFGVRSITDPNGNTVTFARDGITHSAGPRVAFSRDPQGRITTITDPLGATLQYAYDAQGNLASVTNQLGETTTFVYAAHLPHHLEQIIDADGKVMNALAYDAAGRLVRNCDAASQCLDMAHDLVGRQETVIDPTGQHITYTYDEQGNILAVTDGLGHTTTFVYDDDNNLLQVTDANGHATTYTYDEWGNRLSATKPHAANQSPADFTTVYTYNERNQLTSLTLPTGAQWQLTYDTAGNLTTMQDEAGNLLLERTYDPRGMVTAERDPFGTTTTLYNASGLPVASTDPFADTTTMTYDVGGRLTKMTDAHGTTSAFTYDALGRELMADYGHGITVAYGYEGGPDWTSLDAPTIGHVERRYTARGGLGGWQLANGSEVTYGHDSAGRLIEAIDPLGHTTRYQYDDAGRPTQITDATGATETLAYDPGGRLTRRIDALGGITHYAYMPDGRLASLTDARGHTWTYRHTPTTITVTDPLGRATTTAQSPHGLPTTLVHPDGTTSRTEYLLTSPLQDAEDYPTVHTDAGGRTRTYTYTPTGQLATATDLGSGTYHYHYDKDTLVGVTDPAGETRMFTYDALDNLAAITFPDGTVETTTYGRNNQPATITRPSGTPVTFTYDDAGRQIARRSSSGEDTQWTWNASNAPTALQDSTGTTHYQYDERGALVGIDFSSGAHLHYERDLLGRITAVRAQPNPAVAYMTRYVYDAVGNLINVFDPTGGETVMTYDAANRLQQRVLPNGVSTMYTYDDRDHLMSVIHRQADGTVLASATYTRAAGGEPTRIVWEDGSAVYLTYDAAWRLSSEAYYDAAGTLVEEIVYTYDAAGNRLTRTDATGTAASSYTSGWQLVHVAAPTGAETYTYDADGRVTAITRDAKALALTYDTTDQLTAVHVSPDNMHMTYAANGMGHRVHAQDATGTRRFVVGPTLVEELASPYLITDTAGTLRMGYVYAGEQPLMRFNAEGPVYYLTDGSGSVMALADATGTRLARFVYNSFGELRTAAGPAAALPAAAGGDFRFHGAWLEAATGLYHMRAREYDPRTGRFLSRDPAEPDLFEPESLHPYVFAYGNPHVYRDPTGMVTLHDLSTGMASQNILRRSRPLMARQLTGVVREKVGEFTTNVLYRTLEGLLPDNSDFKRIAHLYNSGSEDVQQVLGDQFGGLVEHLLCNFVFRGSKFSNYLYFEARLSLNGDPQDNGLPCAQIDDTKLRKKHRKGNEIKPDFLIAPYPPTELKRGSFVKRGYLVGEFKLSTSRLLKDSKKPQFRAIANYARGYQWIPTALYVVPFSKGFSADKQAILKARAAKYGFLLYVLTIQ